MPREGALTESMSSVAPTSRHYSPNVSDVWLAFANRGEARGAVFAVAREESDPAVSLQPEHSLASNLSSYNLAAPSGSFATATASIGSMNPTLLFAVYTP
jgi:hypothetical protein